MAEKKDAGLYQDKDGKWYYRIKMASDANGNKVDIQKKLDDNGQPFKNKTACKRAREKKMVELLESGLETDKESYPSILKDIWKIFLEKDSKDKAASTVRKYESVWRIHVAPRFGNTKLKDMTVSDMKGLLIDAYNDGLKYSYVESFLKLFYLLFGIAYREEKIDPLQYTRMFLDKGTRLSMPEKRALDEEEEGNRVFAQYELKQIFDIVKESNLQTAFMCGLYLGTREGETFGLRWQDINWEKKTIKIRRTMYYDEGSFCVGPVKTLKSFREIEVPDVLMQHFREKYRIQQRAKQKISYRNTERVLDKTKYKAGVPLIGADFINRKENGELCTHNSVKYYSDKIKKETSVDDFKFHSLRKTHLTTLASNGCPVQELLKRAGHKKVSTTMKFYLNSDKTSKEKLLFCLTKINTDEPLIEVGEGSAKKVMLESEYIAYRKICESIPHMVSEECTYNVVRQAS